MLAYKRHGPVEVVAYVAVYYAGGYIGCKECGDDDSEKYSALHVVGVFKLLVPCAVILCE